MPTVFLLDERKNIRILLNCAAFAGSPIVVELRQHNNWNPELAGRRLNRARALCNLALPVIGPVRGFHQLHVIDD